MEIESNDNLPDYTAGNEAVLGEGKNDDASMNNNIPVTGQQLVTSSLETSIRKLMENTKSMPLPPRAPDLLHLYDQQSPDQRLYWDRSHYDSPASQIRALTKSSTLYVGNLAFTTRVVHVRSHFSQLGPVQRIIMGLDRIRKTPCGFCFVQYYHRKHALAAVSLLSGTKLDGRIIRVELDAGFQPGRQYGRGVSGGQVRDDRRQQRTQHQQQRISGQKRSHDNGANTSGNDTNRPRMDDALPSARNSAAAADSDNAYYGPGRVGDGDNITNQDVTNEDSNNIDVEGNAGGIKGEDDDDYVMEDGPSPSKRQKRS